SGAAAGGAAGRGTLVIAELALCMTLLIGAGLMLRSFERLQSVDPGFRPDNLVTMGIKLSPSRYPEDHQVAAFFEQLVARVKTLPGVIDAGAVEFLPFSGLDSSTGFFVEGKPIPTAADTTETHYRAVTQDYFHTMNIAMVSGRPFADGDV